MYSPASNDCRYRGVSLPDLNEGRRDWLSDQCLQGKNCPEGLQPNQTRSLYPQSGNSLPPEYANAPARGSVRVGIESLRLPRASEQQGSRGVGDRLRYLSRAARVQALYVALYAVWTALTVVRKVLEPRSGVDVPER